MVFVLWCVFSLQTLRVIKDNLKLQAFLKPSVIKRLFETFGNQKIGPRAGAYAKKILINLAPNYYFAFDI